VLGVLVKWPAEVWIYDPDHSLAAGDEAAGGVVARGGSNGSARVEVPHAQAGSFVWTLQHVTIVTLTLGLMVTLGSVFITGIVASRYQFKYESFIWKIENPTGWPALSQGRRSRDLLVRR
jgi:hypothetical protein